MVKNVKMNEYFTFKYLNKKTESQMKIVLKMCRPMALRLLDSVYTVPS